MSEDSNSLLVGRVARTHGNRGQVIVNPDTDFPDARFTVGQVLLVGPAETPATITEVRFHQGRPIIGLTGVATMNDAEALAGAELRIAEADIPALPAGTFYRHDLVGCEVRDGADAVIGIVTAVDGPMDRSHLVIAGDRGDVLIPLVADICVRVDPAAKRIVVHPPDGLLDANAPSRR